MSLLDAIDARAALLLFASRLSGDYLYGWGAESPAEGGYDCSGLVHEVLCQTARHWPELYDGQRRPARGLHDYYVDRGVSELHQVDELLPGCVVFYRRPGRSIHHVALHLVTLPALTLERAHQPVEVGPVALESGGGGSSTTSPRAALLRSAGVRLTASDAHGAGEEWMAVDPVVVL